MISWNGSITSGFSSSAGERDNRKRKHECLGRRGERESGAGTILDERVLPVRRALKPGRAPFKRRPG